MPENNLIFYILDRLNVILRRSNIFFENSQSFQSVFHLPILPNLIFRTIMPYFLVLLMLIYQTPKNINLKVFTKDQKK